jgi:hypothetical protein
VVERLRKRVEIGRVWIVADRGMISEETITAVEERGWAYILGARMRSWHEVSDQVLSRPGRYPWVVPPRTKAKDPSPLKVKQVWVGSFTKGPQPPQPDPRLLGCKHVLTYHNKSGPLIQWFSYPTNFRGSQVNQLPAHHERLTW